MRSYIFPFVILSSILFFSCNNYNDKEQASLDAETSYTGVTGDSVKLVKSGSLQVKVKDIEQSTREISGLAKQLGGMVYEQHINYNETGRNELKVSRDSLMMITVLQPQADISVRVPSQHLEDFLYTVTDMGFTRNRRLQVDDKSLEYLQNILKQKNREGTLEKPSRFKDKSLTGKQVIDIKDEITGQEIANKMIDGNANYSLVNLVLIQNALVKKEVIANYIVSDYSLPFTHRLGIALSNGWQFFLDFLLIISNLWMFILGGIITWTIYRGFHHKSKRYALRKAQ